MAKSKGFLFTPYQDDIQRAKEIAQETGLKSVSAMLRMLLRKYIKEYEECQTKEVLNNTKKTLP